MSHRPYQSAPQKGELDDNRFYNKFHEKLSRNLLKKFSSLFLLTTLAVLVDNLVVNSIPQEISQHRLESQAQRGIQVLTDQWLSVEKVSGNVTYRNLYNYANRPAKIGDRLQFASDEIATGKNSTAQLRIDTAVGTIYLSENTTMRINSFRVTPNQGRVTNLLISKGKARLQVRKFTNRSSQLNIQTPAGVSGVRGTDFIVLAQPSGNMVVSTYNGKVASTAQGRTELIGGGLENLTIVGNPPLPAVAIANNPNLQYTVTRNTSGFRRSIFLTARTNPVNVVTVDGRAQSLDRNGSFAIEFPATTNLIVNVRVETPQGKVKIYNIPVL